MIISQSIMKQDTISGTETLDKGDTVSVLIYLRFFEAEVGPLLYVGWNSL